MFLSVIYYKFQEYRKSNKWVFPILMFFCYLAMAYTFPPYYIHSSYALSATVTYFLMVWGGYSVYDSSFLEIEQIIYLKARKKIYSILGRLFVIIMLAILYAFIGTIFPMAVLRDKVAVYGREVVWLDIAVALIIHLMFGIAGGLIGLIFRSITFVYPKLVLLITPLYALLGLISGPILKKAPLLKVILWISPPLEPIIKVMNQNEYMTVSLLLIPVGVFGIYLVCQVIVYLIIMKNKSVE